MQVLAWFKAWSSVSCRSVDRLVGGARNVFESPMMMVMVISYAYLGFSHICRPKTNQPPDRKVGGRPLPLKTVHPL